MRALHDGSINFLDANSLYQLEDEALIKVETAEAVLYNFERQPFIELRWICCDHIFYKLWFVLVLVHFEGHILIVKSIKVKLWDPFHKNIFFQRLAPGEINQIWLPPENSPEKIYSIPFSKNQPPFYVLFRASWF